MNKMGIVNGKTELKQGFRTGGNKGFHIVFPNGWTVSVQIGKGNYCENYDLDADDIVDLYTEKPNLQSIDEEVWCWNKDKH